MALPCTPENLQNALAQLKEDGKAFRTAAEREAIDAKRPQSIAEQTARNHQLKESKQWTPDNA